MARLSRQASAVHRARAMRRACSTSRMRRASSGSGVFGLCHWHKETTIFIKRQVRSRELCWECDNPSCGQKHFGFKIKYGDWHWEFSSREDIERATSTASRIYTGDSATEGDVWWCLNPWTGQRVSGHM